ncbi:hypothetical protein BC829DRAFT_422341 [Chytridium lagenaria]|nr:hypothetical protein BC829DRAFT_422341 [Chytridium lagenaria]
MYQRPSYGNQAPHQYGQQSNSFNLPQPQYGSRPLPNPPSSSSSGSPRSNLRTGMDTLKPGGAAGTIFRTRYQKTAMRRPPPSPDQDVKDAYMASLIFADAPKAVVAAPPAPHHAPMHAATFGENITGALESLSIKMKEPEQVMSKVSGNSLFLSVTTINVFLARVKQKAEVLKMIPKVDHTKHFAMAGLKFCEQAVHIKPAQMADINLLLTLLATYMEREIKPLKLDPSSYDSTFLKTTEMFINTIREALNQEKNSREALEHHFLKERAENNAALKAHLSRFLLETKGIQATDKTPLADWLRIVFNITTEEHSANVLHVKKICSERISLGELEAYIRSLEQSNVPSAPKNDFSSNEAYENWKLKELATMNGFRKIEDSKKLFFPPKRRTYLKALLKKCMEHDLTSIPANVKPEEAEFSKTSKHLISECAQRWQISKDCRDLALHEYFIDGFLEGEVSLSHLAVRITPLFNLTNDIQHMRISDIEYHIFLLKKLNKGLQDILKNFIELLKGEPSVSRMTVKHLADLMMRINQNNAYRMYSDGLLENIPEIMTGILQGAIIARFNELEKESASIPGANTPDRTDNSSVSTVSTKLSEEDELYNAISLKFAHHFPDPIAKTVRVRSLVEETYMKFYIIKMENLRMVLKNLERISIDDVLGPHGLYQEVSNLFSKLEPETVDKAQFNIEEFFRPFIAEWLSRTDDKWKQWVLNAIKVDNYKPIMPPSTMFSASVRDIFTFFNNGLRFMKKLNTVNASKKEDLYLLFIKVTFKSLELYKEIILEEFETMQNENSDMAISFSNESCMKLNNIVGADLQLKFIFHELGISDRVGMINPEAKRTEDAPENHHKYKITIICDLTTSDPYVRIMVMGAELARTTTIFKNLNPVWNQHFDVNLPQHMLDSQSFLGFEVWDEDVKPFPMISAVSRNANSTFGKLLIRVRRQGEIDDIDFWVIRRLRKEWWRFLWIGLSVTPPRNGKKSSTSSPPPPSLPSKATPPPHREKIEEAMNPIFTYLEKSLSLFNETLDPTLLERRQPSQRVRRCANNRASTLTGASSNDITINPALEKQHEKEVASPSLMCMVVWNELVQKMFQQVNVFGAAGATSTKTSEAIKKNRTTYGRGPAAPQKPALKPLTDSERKQVMVYDLVLEYLKAFFYCEVDGSHYGFGLDKLENRAYLEIRELMDSFAM